MRPYYPRPPAAASRSDTALESRGLAGPGFRLHAFSHESCAIQEPFRANPTGLLHHRQCAHRLFNYLAAQRTQGVFLLRIEDTTPCAAMTNMRCLERTALLGLEWQEGPGRGAQAPYMQSQRALSMRLLQSTSSRRCRLSVLLQRTRARNRAQDRDRRWRRRALRGALFPIEA